MEKKLEVKDLVISFRTVNGKVQAVRDVSFDLYKGETLAIVGESGSGKSVTSRAIMGILAGNAIVEGGEIIYDGQDLLQIPEEEFHKLRGNKIAMIFQDPLSSLNPIMRIGNQLTEAMLLNSKSSQRSARRNFNEALLVMNRYMDKAFPGEEERNKEFCKTFDTFCIESTKLESKYNVAFNAASELKADIDETLFLVEKKQKMDISRLAKSYAKRLGECAHPNVVVCDEEYHAFVQSLNSVALDKSENKKIAFVEVLTDLSAALERCLSKTKPNYFTLGYYVMKHPNEDLSVIPVDELAKLTRKFLDDDFMLEFIARCEKAYKYALDESMSKKKVILKQSDELLEFFNEDTLDRKKTVELSNVIIHQVKDAINKLVVVKNGTEYTFASSLRSAITKYFRGVRQNPKAQAFYEKQVAKRERLIARGKNPDWQVAPRTLVDLDLARKNIRRVLHGLRATYRNQLEAYDSVDINKEVVAFVDYMKEQASGVVYRISRKMAKIRALKLMEEVGIPEPIIRYRQYPFEFSGGMRQRIVIAIALAANPDILICDEPTTALDVTIQAQILELINKIKKERNLSVIFITHDLGVVANMADRVAVMYAGKIVEYGTSDDIFYDPRHPYTWALLASMPDLDTKGKLESIPGTPPNMIYPPKGDAFADRNKYALEIDFEQQPPLFEVSKTHFAATWLLHPNAPKVDPPLAVTQRIERMKKEVQQHDGQ